MAQCPLFKYALVTKPQTVIVMLKIICELRRKNQASVSLETGRFDNIDSVAIISSVCKAVQI